jgi:hypothetical protein
MTDIDFQRAIDSYIVATCERRVVQKNTFRASELSGCVRQCVRNRLGLNEISKESYRRMEVGTQIHRFLQRKVGIGHIGRPVEFEKYVQMPFDYCDGIITGHVDCWDGKTVYDFKTTSNVEQTMKYPTNVSYMYQLSFYYHALGANGAVIVYVDKRNLEIRQLRIVPLNLQQIINFCMLVSSTEAYVKPDFQPADLEKLPNKDDCMACRFEEGRPALPKMG